MKQKRSCANCGHQRNWHGANGVACIPNVHGPYKPCGCRKYRERPSRARDNSKAIDGPMLSRYLNRMREKDQKI